MTFVEHLTNYAAYHRDSRNIMTHLFGVPVIVFAVIVLLSRPAFSIAGFELNPAVVAYVVAMLFYLKLDLVFGVLMAVMMGAGLYGAMQIAQMSTLVWLSAGLGLFIGGWAVQFIGHYYEGKKPAFVDDLSGLLIGPLFVTAEVLFAIGLFGDLKAQIESQVGPVRKASASQASA